MADKSAAHPSDFPPGAPNMKTNHAGAAHPRRLQTAAILALRDTQAAGPVAFIRRLNAAV